MARRVRMGLWKSVAYGGVGLDGRDLKIWRSVVGLTLFFFFVPAAAASAMRARGTVPGR